MMFTEKEILNELKEKGDSLKGRYAVILYSTGGAMPVYVYSIGAKRIKTMGMFEFACIPLRAGMKTFATREEAVKHLKKTGWIDGNGDVTEKALSVNIKAVDFAKI